MTTDNRTNEKIETRKCSNQACPLRRAHSGPCAPSDWKPGAPSEAQVEAALAAHEAHKPTRAQVEAAARKWIERLDSDAHWARSPGAREKASSEKKILEWLLEAAAGVAPPAPSEYAYCPIHGDLLAANRSYRCGNAPTGHEYAAPVKSSSTVGDTMHGIAAEALTNLIEHEYSRHTIPLYGMLDLWMALYGTSHPQFDEFYEKHGYAETWARLLAEVRSRAAAADAVVTVEEVEDVAYFALRYAGERRAVSERLSKKLACAILDLLRGGEGR